jgi:hypothetical protein
MIRIEIANPGKGLIRMIHSLKTRTDIRCHYIHARYVVVWYDPTEITADEIISMTGGTIIHPDPDQLRREESRVSM